MRTLSIKMPMDDAAAADVVGLSKKQRDRLEQLIVAKSRLVDRNGLLIAYERDRYIEAQIIRYLYDEDGNPRSIGETCNLASYQGIEP